MSCQCSAVQCKFGCLPGWPKQDYVGCSLWENVNKWPKAKNLSYDELDLQMYSKSGTSRLTIKDKSFAFALRSRTIDVNCNKLQGQTNVKCRLGCDQDESQPHLLHCSALRDSAIVKEMPIYEDIHGKSVEKIETLSKILHQKFKLFKETAETPQVNSSQACSATASSNINICKNSVNIHDAVELDKTVF